MTVQPNKHSERVNVLIGLQFSSQWSYLRKQEKCKWIHENWEKAIYFRDINSFFVTVLNMQQTAIKKIPYQINGRVQNSILWIYYNFYLPKVRRILCFGGFNSSKNLLFCQIQQLDRFSVNSKSVSTEFNTLWRIQCFDEFKVWLKNSINSMNSIEYSMVFNEFKPVANKRFSKFTRLNFKPC